MADIFISYASEDRQRVEKIASALEDAGFSVWWDRKIASGAEFSSDIEQALREASVALVVWSKASTESHWVKDEAVYARDHGKLCPISLDGTAPPMGFRQIQCADFSSWRGNVQDPAFRELLDVFTARTGESAARPAPSLDAKPSRPFPFALAGAGAAALLAFILGVVFLRGPGETPTSQTQPLAATNEQGNAGADTAVRSDKSVAVLPFIDLSPNKDQEYFSDGLTEEILNSLARLPELKVTARTSAFYFKGKDIPVPEIAETLEVKNIVEGSVRRAGNRLRITAQLIRAEDGIHLWSDTYDGTLNDIFDVQEAIAENIATTLEVYLDADAREAMFAHGTRDVEAFDHYLRGRAQQAEWHDHYEGDGIWRANQSFAKAVERDPTMARAYFHMADPYAHYF
ncbi:MAG: TIR domain-containing protein, partial [Marinicaulis sp.]|nr:TIR domain-containing protein [Marinicaulis sp.]